MCCLYNIYPVKESELWSYILTAQIESIILKYEFSNVNFFFFNSSEFINLK